MKKWGFLLLMMGCFSFILFYILSHSEDKVVIQPYESTDNGATYDQENTVGIQQIEISREQIYHGDLLLVNNEYPVYEGSIKTDVVNLSMHNELTEGYMLLDSESYLSKEIAGYFIEMIAHAKNDGYHNFAFTSGFRSFAEQQSLYEQMGSDRALPPGYSEHNLGLALDVGSTQMKMEDAPEGKWIAKNAWKHGFILRYPEDKTEITGIQYEPWHIRYVGLPHSAVMKEEGFVLEEYLDYIEEKRNISVKFNDATYTVSYYPFTENMNVTIPDNHEYNISGDNKGGVIVTIFQ